MLCYFSVLADGRKKNSIFAAANTKFAEYLAFLMRMSMQFFFYDIDIEVYNFPCLLKFPRLKGTTSSKVVTLACVHVGFTLLLCKVVENLKRR